MEFNSEEKNQLVRLINRVVDGGEGSMAKCERKKRKNYKK